ncbi:nucleolar GTP-binding protein 1 (GTPBP4) [Vairimorpha necatrix]|uniref:Nucleolar GTP-binding protein 1 (GTPBP4) n=1 Tax=Vairimorpha necatrix TaxID=6039 RepID=A0AAX4JCC0_9MICR
MKVNFNYITPVPQNTSLIDIALSKTQKRSPTVVHPQYSIVRIRKFYMHKVKKAGEEFKLRLETIVKEFPRLEDIHPFYSDLINVLYDKDHYKLALGHVSSTRKVCEGIVKEFVKLLKYGDTLYRCKQLKRGALGRMASACKKLDKTLTYLEEVRMHLGRLPSIDPNSRSLLICGFPNVGKSSFINKISRADVEVQPYAFTTKSLYVGHFDYNYLNWQVIDTPGILDHELEDRNTIEMLSITALAHIKAVVLYFFDLSGNCGHNIDEQISLFNTLSPLLDSKIVIVLSKCDLLKLDNVQDLKDKDLLKNFLQDKIFIEISTQDEFNVERAKKLACDILLEERVDRKLENEKIKEYINRITMSKSRYQKEKEPPREIKREIEELNNEQERYFCKEEYKYDQIPEIINGKNFCDFIDDDIVRKLNEMEEEEDKMFAIYTKNYDILTKEQREDMKKIYDKIEEKKIERELRKTNKVPRSKQINRKNTQIVKVNRRDRIPVHLANDKKPDRSKEKSRFDTKGHYERKPKHFFRFKGKNNRR